MFPTHMEWNSFLEGNIIKSLTHDILCFAGTLAIMILRQPQAPGHAFDLGRIWM